jgi:Leucine-rich repeat (LRR) protein
VDVASLQPLDWATKLEAGPPVAALALAPALAPAPSSQKPLPSSFVPPTDPNGPNGQARPSSRLRRLSLRHNLLDDDAAVCLALGLSACSSLTDLDLSFNQASQQRTRRRSAPISSAPTKPMDNGP